MRDWILWAANVVWRSVTRHSWLLTAVGGALAAVGGIITNVTAAATFKPSCGENAFCVEGLRLFLLHTYEGWMIVAGVVFTALGSLAVYQQQEQISSLTVDLAAARKALNSLGEVHALVNTQLNNSTVDVFKVFSLILMQASEELGFGVNERISIYRASDEKFYVIGRYALNANYGSVRRKYHPRGSGVIEKAWEDGWAEFENRFQPDGNGAAKKRYAEEHFNKCKVPVKVISSITMKSRSYRALAIRGGDLGAPLAVICLESTEWRRFADLDRPAVQRRFDQLAILLEALEHHVASLDNAMSEGF